MRNAPGCAPGAGLRSERAALGGFDFDFLGRLLCFGFFRQGYGQHALGEIRLDLIGIYALRQLKGTLERTDVSFTQIVFFVLFFFVLFFFVLFFFFLPAARL